MEDEVNTRFLLTARVAALTTILVIAGCGKKKPPTPPPAPPPPPPAPTASLSANPTTVEAGQPTQLTWTTENATDVSIEGVGAVNPSGSQSATPTDSITYRLVAKGPGGQQEATARVTVNRPAPVAATPPPPSMTDEQLFQQNVKDMFFDYDSYQLRPNDQQQLAAAAQFLNQHRDWKVRVEGYCDERGSTEYNMALGDSRANAAKQALAAAGVDASRLSAVSFGKEKPFCSESSEQCWQQNRRAHFVLAR